MARDAKRLQIGPIKAGTAVFERHHVIHHPGRNQATVGLARQAKRVFTKHCGPQQPPVPGLIEADFGIKASPRASVVAINKRLMLGAMPRLCQNGCATRVSTRSGRAFWHRQVRLIQKILEIPAPIRLALPANSASMQLSIDK